MVYKCVVPNCGVIYPNSSKIILHRFPADEVLRRQWMKSCAITTHLISYRVCDNHFLPEDIKDNGRLMPNAVPSIQLGVNLHLNSENLSQTNISTNNNSKPNGADSPQRSDTSTSLITNISPTQTSIKYPSCFNDLTVEHFSTPKRAKIHLEFAKQKYNDVLKKLSKVQDMYLKCINNKKQEDSNHLTENASQLIKMPSLQVKIEKEEPIIALPQESTPMRTTRPPVHGLNLNRMPSLQVKIEKEEPIITLPQESSYSYNTLFRYFSVSDIKAESKFNPTS